MKLFVGAKGLIAREDGKVLIVRESSEYDEGTEEGNWDVVGGRIESGELLLEGLAREVSEESGLKIIIGDVLGVTENFPVIHNEKCQIIRVYYACSVSNSDVKLSADHDAFDWIEPSAHASYNVMDDLHKIFETYIKTL